MTTTQAAPIPLRVWLMRIAALALAYYLSARVGLLLAFSTTNASAVWPPSGIAFAALLIWGWRAWPGIAIGAFAANFAVFAANGVTGPAIPYVSFAIAAGNTLEGLAGALLLRRVLRVRGGIDDPGKVYKFALATALMAMIAAAIGTSVLLAAQIAPEAARWTIASTWWLGDAAGIAVITPLCLAWQRGSPALRRPRSLAERAAALMLLSLLLFVVFGQRYGGDVAYRVTAYLMLPCVGWAAFRFGQRGVTLALLLVTGGAVWGTTHGMGPFAVGTLNDSLLSLESFIALCCVIGMALAADLEQSAVGRSGEGRGRLFLHWATLFVGLALTLVAWHIISTGTEQRAQDRFAFEVDTIRQRINERVGDYEQVLRGAQGLYSASQEVQRDEWRHYIDNLDLKKNYPGLQAIGYASALTPAQKAPFEQRARDQGFPDYRIWPAGERGHYVPIMYVEPFEGRNLRAFGFDMYSEPTRRAVLDEAADSGQMAVSGKLALVQDDAPGAAPGSTGFLMVLPVYRHGAPTASVAQRRAALEGFVYSPFRMHDLMDSLLGSHFPALKLDIFDGERVDAAQLMYSSERSGDEPRLGYPNPLTATQRLPIADHNWLLSVTTRPAFEAGVDRQKSLIVMIAGAMISLLFFSMVRALAATRERALVLAGEMTTALQESEVKFSSLVESASEFCIIATDLRGKIQVFSVGAERMLGYAAREIVGSSGVLPIHVDEEIAARARELTAQLGRPVAGFEVLVAIARTGRSETREWTYVRKDGTRLPVQLTTTAITEANGAITGFLGIARDITAQKDAERELLAAKELAELGNLAKSEFVANISHELRTPMNAVLGMAYLLGSSPMSPEQRKTLDMLRASGQSLLTILNDILDFSKIEAGKMETEPAPFRLEDVLRALANIMTASAGDKDIELAIGVDADVPDALEGDAMRLQQVLVNLVGNAIKFTEQGEVVLHVSCLGCDDDSARLRFTVRDTGIGISDVQRERLFSPFTQADSSMTRRFGGTGLGLTISRRLVELMGGRIAVHSTLGEGSSFTVELPLRRLADAGDPARVQAAPLRVLVADDNATSRGFLASIVGARGWQADCVDGGAAALALVEQSLARGTPYDVVLADWQMPQMDGAATMDAVRALAPAMPVIIMVSAYGRGRLMEAPRPVQADAFLAKPVTASSLSDAVQEAIARRKVGQPVAPPLAQPAARRLHGHLLLVEDNPLNQSVALGILELAGATVDVVDDGRKAVERLRQHPARYRMVLMDVQMPVMDGFAATRAIRGELGLTLPVLAMTAGVMESERAQCAACGMDDFIAKPVDVEQMLVTIARHLGDGTAPPGSPARADASDGVFNVDQLMAIAGANQAYVDMTVNLVRKVVANGTHEADGAMQRWRAGQAAEAGKVFHTLRGSIGSLGAKRFAVAAQQMEATLRGDNAARIEQQYALVRRELEATLAAAGAWLERQPARLPAAPAAQLLQPASLAALRRLLEERNLDACTSYEALRAALNGQLDRAAAAALDSAFEKLDFDGALQALAVLPGARVPR